MRKITILSSVLLVAIAVIAVKYFSALGVTNNNSLKVLKYIPSDAAIIMSYNNEDSFYDIIKDYEPFDAIIGETRAAELHQLNNLLLKPNTLRQLTEGSKIYISFLPRKTDSLDFLFSFAFKEKIKGTDILEDLKNLPGLSIKNTSGANLYKLSFNTIDKPFFLLISNDAATGSFSEELMLRCSDPKTEKLSKEFINEINENSSRNQNSPFRLFINHHILPAFLSNFIRGKSDGNLSLLNKIAGFSSLNMNFKSDALMFNGISIPDTNKPSYLNLFLNQTPVKTRLKSLLPENTANSIIFGLSNYKTFYSALKQYLNTKGELKRLEKQIQSIKKETGIDLQKDLRGKFTSEFAIVETSSRERLGIIPVSNGSKVSFSLHLISQSVTENVSRLNYSNILYYYLGDPFKRFDRPYFGVIDNYLIIGNSANAVQKYMDDYANGRFISKTKEYAEHDMLVANQSNVLYFLNNKNSEKSISATLKNGFAAAFSDETYGLKNFYGFSWQWSSDRKQFQTNLYSNYTKDPKIELRSVWSFEMNSRIAIAPQIFNYSGRPIILVQDKVNNLFALSNDGKKLWATQLDGKISGSIFQLKDGSFLFNTARRLYRTSLNGINLPGFPVSLPFNASSGLTVSSPDPAFAKIFIPAQTMILAYDCSAKSIPGWNKELPGKIVHDLKLATNNNVNYLIAATRNGQFFFFNYNGQMAGKAAVTVKSEFKNPLISYNTATGPGFVTTDTSGTVFLIGLDGKIKKKAINTFSNLHSFEYRNVTGDESPEFIFLDKSQLNVYGQDGIPLFTFDLNDSLNPDLQVFTFNKSDYYIGVSASDNGQLYLFNSDGNLFKGFPVKGTGSFTIGYLKNDGIRYLLCGTSDGRLHAYKL